MRVAILGVGTVGNEVANILIENEKPITARAGVKIEPVIGVVRDLSKKRSAKIPLSDDLNSVINRDDIDVFVELMGGVEKPYEIVSEILKRKKAVVTANKALLAYHRYELENLASSTPFGYEASVAGGIPIIKALREGLSANKIEKIIGILNGTSNYILTNMMQKNENFEDALKKAQELGYAEADPTFDIGGFDAAHKLLILASIAYGAQGRPEDILIKGIDRISKEDIYFAHEFEYVIKLLAIAKRIDESRVELRVHPALIPQNAMLSKVGGAMNGVSVFGDCMSESMFYGPGAGGRATASAVISDLIDIARGNKSPILGYKKELENDFVISPMSEICTKYYLRIRVKDEKGVLAKITNILSENNLSIDSFLQKPKQKTEECVTLFFTTHTSLEADVKRAMGELDAQEFIIQRPFMIRIEE
ncbi:homoserine dehydrogenase [Campylobacter sp. VBCF_05 NA6]|uniref:homoserine dehydrogenase n=1 Tax=unclassified Campylobacter TaxID=2593542 RepID=UPI0022E9DCDC|nr:MULTISPECIES: homoserine dehydrogenase [unclassified Campylobacter]MDA3057425.1 homoserine dehydrogenase [Campylobacter sp. VBCF_04 NA7]MDA3059003.1 homoserine dehydrogenase [Campylobacter sp. VBCF_05 NA6]